MLKIYWVLFRIVKPLAKLLPHFIYQYLYKRKGYFMSVRGIKTLLLGKFMKPKIENFGIIVPEGQECVVLGNGPSLKDSFNDPATFEFIKKRHKICVNIFPLSDYFFELKPEYYLLVDPAYYDKNISSKLRESFLKVAERLSKVDWEMKFFMPIHAQTWNYFTEVVKKNKNIKFIFINTTGSDLATPEEVRFSDYKLNLSMPFAMTVLVCAIYLPLNLGYAKTYIFGADHDWFKNIEVDDNNVLWIIDSHFYDKNQNSPKLPCYADGSRDKTEKIAELFASQQIVFTSHNELEKYANHLEKKIYNASAKSYIDAYERIKISKKA